MKKLYCQLAIALSLSMIVSIKAKVFAQSADIKVATPLTSSSNSQSNSCEEGKQASQSIRLYYLRSATTIKDILTKIAEANPCIKGTVIEVQGENEIILYGYQNQREELQRIIAILDLPRESVSLDMWGIRISSDNPEQLAEAMGKINRQIDKTQTILQYTYKKLEDYAREIKIDNNFSKLFEDTLGYKTALDEDSPSLSMVDILLRMNAANDPIQNYNTTAKNLNCLFKQEEYQPYVEALPEKDRSDEEVSSQKQEKQPFGNYFRIGLHQDQLNPKDKLPNCNQKNSDPIKTISSEKDVLLENLRIRGAILDFALHYSHLKQEPDKFDPDSLQQSADNLESILHPVVDAINRDVKELFIEPTLAEIQSIVRDYDDVEYAEVGKTTIAGLNGITSTVESTSVSVFNETPPLRLNELLADAGINANDLLPEAGTNAIPAVSVAKLIAALGKDRSLWQELTSEVTLNITPSVLRNSASAELEIDLTTGPGEGGTREEGVRPLSRISQNHVKTSVYVDTLDIFALSTFNNQTTIDGGRTYIPIVGTIWEGVFSGIPVFGDLFSWENAPKNVQHQSIVLTNSFIIPTAMGLAPLYSQKTHKQLATDRQKSEVEADQFERLASEVEIYKNQRRQDIEREHN